MALAAVVVRAVLAGFRRRSHGRLLAFARPAPNSAPTQSDHIRVRRLRARDRVLLGAEQSRRKSEPGSARPHRRRGLYRGPALFHRGSPQPGEHGAGVLLRRRRLGQPPGRLHHHPAVREADLSDLAAQPQPKDQRGGDRHPGLTRRVQERDTTKLPEHHLLGPRRLRHPSGGAGLLRQERQPAGPGRCVTPRRAHQGTRDRRPGPESHAGPRQPDRHPQGHAPRPQDHRRPSQRRGGRAVLQVRHLAGCLDRGDELRLECRRILHLRGARAAVRQIRPADGRRGRTPGDNHSRPGHGGPGLQRGLRHQPGCPEPGGRAALRCARLHRQQRRGQGPHRRPELLRVHGGPRSRKSRRREWPAGRLNLQSLHAGRPHQGRLLTDVGLSGPARGGTSPRQPERDTVESHQLRAREHRPDHEPGRRHRGLHQHGLRPGGRPLRGVHPRFDGRSSRDRSGRAPRGLSLPGPGNR